MDQRNPTAGGPPADLRYRLLVLLLLLPVLLAIPGCGGDTGESDAPVLELWAHAGQASERKTLESQVARFNQSGPPLQVRLTLIPEGSYNAQVQAAAVADELPDLLEFDGPFLYSYVWQGRLRPLDDLLPQTLIDDLLPSILAQGRYRERLWSVGSFDSGLGLYADAARLEAAGIRLPTPGRPWTLDEFEGILERLARDDADGQVLDLKLNYAGEWITYAFSPLLQSAGGDLIARPALDRAEGVLDGTASVSAMRAVQGWIERGRVDPNIDDDAFASGRVALAFGGHWNYPRYRERLGERLRLLPLPDFGRGSRTGQGSWSWAVTAGSRNPRAAARFIAFLLQPDEVLTMCQANGAVPATRSAIERSVLYREGGPLRLFVDQLRGGQAVPRPRTPAYPVITAEFQQAFERIRSGTAAQSALTRAARAIDLEIADNRGYPWLFERTAGR